MVRAATAAIVVSAMLNSWTAGFQAAPPAGAPAGAGTSSADDLWTAARRGDAAKVKLIVESGVDVNTRFRYDTTALAYACDHGHVQVVKVLLDLGADVNVKDSFYGQTPLGWAVSPAQAHTPEHDEIVRLLAPKVASGLEPAAFAAAGEGLSTSLAILLERITTSPAMLTDLHDWALQNEHPETAEMLQKRGAQTTSGDALTLSSIQPEQFAGRYRSAKGDEVNVVVTVDTLSATLPGGRTLPLVAIAPMTFRGKDMAAIRLTFDLDAAGQSTRLVVSQFGEQTTFLPVKDR